MFKNIQVMRYMGNKRKLLNFIIPTILVNSTETKAVLDLFSGTSSVGYALKENRIVYSNDIQKYGEIIAKGLMNNYNKEILNNILNKIIKCNFYNENYKNLKNKLNIPYNIEQKVLNDNIDNYDIKEQKQKIEFYSEFIDKYPYYYSNNEDIYNLNKWTSNEIKKRKINNKLFPYILCSTYFINGFFGIKQSIEIDSIRYAIDKTCNENEKPLFLIGLLYAMSSSITSVGHYCQYRHITNKNTYKEIVKIRKKSIYNQFITRMKELINIIQNNSCLENKCNLKNNSFTMNYIDILKNDKIMKNVSCVYADPPYNNHDYSKYYHVPETIILYDYPNLVLNKEKNKCLKGRYRDYRRNTTPFCKKTTVKQAFDDLIKNCYLKNVTLILSYSDNGFVTIEELIDLFKKYYKHVYSYSCNYNHSRLGRKDVINLNEYIILGKF